MAHASFTQGDVMTVNERLSKAHCKGQQLIYF